MSNKTLAVVAHDNGATIARKTRKRPLGRRTILDNKLTKQICDLLAAGNSIKTTMELVGHDETVFYDWVNKGEEGQKRIYSQFAKKTSRARGKAKQHLLKIIVKQAPQDWKAAAWTLSHCWPLEFSESSALQIDSRFCGVILLPEKEQKEP